MSKDNVWVLMDGDKHYRENSTITGAELRMLAATPGDVLPAEQGGFHLVVALERLHDPFNLGIVQMASVNTSTEVPTPTTPIDTLPELRLANSMRSFVALCGLSPFTTSPTRR